MNKELHNLLEEIDRQIIKIKLSLRELQKRYEHLEDLSKLETDVYKTEIALSSIINSKNFSDGT